MNENYFRELFQKLVESGQLSSKTAEELLQKNSKNPIRTKPKTKKLSKNKRKDSLNEVL